MQRPLKDGNKIAGTYGENSFTSSYPSEEQIFLEETWVLNKEGRFERLRESTKGSIILFSNMVSLNCLKKINNTQGFIFLKRTTGNRSKNDGCQPKVPRVEKNGYQPIRSQKKSSPTSPPKKP